MKTINFHLSNPIKPGELENAYANGMIKKSELKAGAYYIGECRNASIARWNGKVFHYLRSKFGNVFAEEINHPEDDNGFDLFIPMEEVKITYE